MKKIKTISLIVISLIAIALFFVVCVQLYQIDKLSESNNECNNQLNLTKEKSLKLEAGWEKCLNSWNQTLQVCYGK
jgi:PBP1b-binding outer membrane lipoprotein LpoB